MLNFQTSVSRKPVDHPPMSHPGMPVDHPPKSHPGMPVDHPLMSHPGIPVDHPPMSHPGIPVDHPPMSHPGMPVDHPLTSHPGMPVDHPPMSHSGIPVDHPSMSHPGMPVDHPLTSHPGMPVDHPPMSHLSMPVDHPPMSHPGMPVDHPLTSHPGMPLDVWKKMESDGPLFQHPSNTPTLDEYRRLTTLRVNRIRDYNFVPLDVAIEDPIKPLTLIILLYEYDASLSLKYAIPFGFFFNALLALGQPKHLEFLDAANKEEVGTRDISFGCYALTEVAHGTNAKKMQTTATFDVKTQQFILHSAGFEAAKCWAGSLGKAATHGTVFAQLVTPDGVCHGLHAFIVPLRDPNTLLVHPGIIIGDMGEKLGLNAVDNGFAIFNQYRIPKDNLLNKIGSVTPSGQYVSPVKDSRKRFGASLGALTVGRVVINCISTVNLSKAVTIAVRYSAVRKQFGPTEDGEELPVIEYQLQASSPSEQ
uniref:Acyl-CoA oxidase C-alpha1 domain-containing protein n=1 Tax=Timema tahoe TaxID=61484 RepID=A0A7R9IFS9_9NEOP|nr:unnamed protein product [Timema tahoe]